MNPTVCLVPLRSPGAGKTRLTPGLDREHRAALTGAMLADVVAVLRGVGFETVVVAAAGAPAAAAAAALGCDVVLDSPGTHGLDTAVEHARQRVAAGRDLLVVQADLPALRPDDVRAVMEATGQVVIAPTSDGGTGALLRRPSHVMPTRFGRDSGRRHRDLAAVRRLSTTVVSRGGFATDVDTYADLDAVRHLPVGPATRAFLDHLDEVAAG